MKLTQRFGPIPQTVVLDASGNGTITFASNGSAARVTNLFVKVATSVAQATCTIYKGQISDGNALSVTNSGSTGGPASGQIDLTDGETLYVVWRGGDVGAIATATFTGVTLPFDAIGNSHIEWADPVAAGDGSLIYPAIKSPNFTTGVSGWRISRNGDAEFNDVDIRGTLQVDGVNGSYIRIEDSAGTPFIELRPDDVSVTYNYQTALIYGYSDNSASDGTSLIIQSPTFDTNQGISQIFMAGEKSTGEAPYVSLYPRLELSTSVWGPGTLSFGTTRDITATTISSSLIAIDQRTSNTAATGAEAVVLTAVDTLFGGAPTFEANSAYEVIVSGRWQPSIDNRAAAWAAGIPLGRAIFRVRKSNLAGAVIVDFGRILALTPEAYAINHRGIFITSNAVTTNLALTIASGSGAGVNDVVMLGSAGTPSTIEVRYLGDAANYPGSTTLV